MNKFYKPREVCTNNLFYAFPFCALFCTITYVQEKKHSHMWYKSSKPKDLFASKGIHGLCKLAIIYNNIRVFNLFEGCIRRMIMILLELFLTQLATHKICSLHTHFCAWRSPDRAVLYAYVLA